MTEYLTAAGTIFMSVVTAFGAVVSFAFFLLVFFSIFLMNPKDVSFGKVGAVLAGTLVVFCLCSAWWVR